MPTNVNHPRVQRSRASISFNATISIAVALAGFAILHVVGVAMLQRMSAALPIENTRTEIHGD
jgi:hypothetical protein